MVLSKLRALPARLRERLPVPGGRPDLPGPDVDLPTPDTPDVDLPGDDSRDRLSLGLTILSLVGVLLTAISLIARAVLDRVRSDDGVESPSHTPDPTADEPTIDESTETDTDDVPTGTVLDEDTTDESGTASLVPDQEKAEAPRIAPLVGMTANVIYRLYVEKLQGQTDETEETA